MQPPCWTGLRSVTVELDALPDTDLLRCIKIIAISLVRSVETISLFGSMFCISGVQAMMLYYYLLELLTVTNCEVGRIPPLFPVQVATPEDRSITS